MCSKSYASNHIVSIEIQLYRKINNTVVPKKRSISEGRCGRFFCLKCHKSRYFLNLISFLLKKMCFSFICSQSMKNIWVKNWLFFIFNVWSSWYVEIKLNVFWFAQLDIRWNVEKENKVFVTGPIFQTVSSFSIIICFDSASS